jgi:hypothetical protein
MAAKSYLNSYYIFEYVTYKSLAEMFLGSADNSIPITFQIGIQYFGDQNLNANVNFISYALLNSGFIGYLASIATSSIVVMVLSDRYSDKIFNEDKYILNAFAFFFAIRLSEQSIATMLLSGGYFIALILIILTKKESRKN